MALKVYSNPNGLKKILRDIEKEKRRKSILEGSIGKFPKIGLACTGALVFAGALAYCIYGNMDYCAERQAKTIVQTLDRDNQLTNWVYQNGAQRQ